MALTKKEYKPRLADSEIERYMEVFGAVCVEGPKWCGKTWTVLNHANSAVFLLEAEGNYSMREAVALNPKIALGGKPPIAIDEWQAVPAVWDAVRQEIDREGAKGRFLLTGSVMKKTMPQPPAHSGAGRIARIRMRPMSLFEAGASSGRVSLGEMFENAGFEPFHEDVDLERLVALSVRGGWPGNLKTPVASAGLLAREYISAIAETDISEAGGAKRDPSKALLVLRALARNVSTDVGNATLLRDIQNGSVSLSMPTLTSYLDALKRLFVIEEIPGWNFALRSKTRIRQSPKRIFADPSLAVAAYGTSQKKLMADLAAYGLIFENMCLRDLSVYAEANDAKLYHYKDDSKLEVDGIIEMPGGEYGAFEIKLNPARIPEGLAALARFRKKLTERGAPPPQCMAVITGGGAAHQRDDGVYVVPITALRE